MPSICTIPYKHNCSWLSNEEIKNECLLHRRLICSTRIITELNTLGKIMEGLYDMMYEQIGEFNEGISKHL